ncbi:MAG: GTP-binding protein, partial [Syntrophomonadaceae bacterium]|nr:GTP-binding protein [Syntrophomonadaceae bacterium]
MGASCHDVQEDSNVLRKEDKILLMGNPNVGKSVFFTELTGIHAISSNYAGTTVSFLEGTITLGQKKYTLIDVPGTYSMTPTSQAEAVAVRFVESGAKAIICVLDATNLERNLRLGLDLQSYNIPIVYALNMMDVAERHGMEINEKLLAQELGRPVVPTIAVKRQGFKELKAALQNVIETAEQNSCCSNCSNCSSPGHDDNILSSRDRAREITRRVRKTNSPQPNFVDKLGESMMKPWPGIPIAILIMFLSIGVVVGGGKALRALLLLPLVNDIIVPFFRMLFSSFVPEGMLLNVLIGEYGIFVISFEWIIAL